ncbi:MAG: response regulator [Candidatus Parabeggiatoa sp. nov. 3]|nr:MAG: response regulator [Gammaproteobacteria bacterium]RKZ67463.1 MAG: response regulator [Gammaproteobacteria bacterium]HEW97513.1 response regulator [Beggiatoa sp.]
MPEQVILCVDDEEIVLNSLEMQLKEQLGEEYLYEFAENAEDALEIIEELAEENIEIVIIISDWLMPGLKGDEFLIKVHQKFPKTLKVLLTGQADEKAVERAKNQANLLMCIHKPWETRELIETIKSGLATVNC